MKLKKCRRFENSHLNYVSNSRLRFKQGFKKSQKVKLGDPPLALLLPASRVCKSFIWVWLFEKYSERGVIFYFYRQNQLVPGFGLKIEYVIDETEL